MSQSSASPSAISRASPSATATASAGPATPDGEDTGNGDDGGLPVTGSSTGIVAGADGALLLLGGAGYLIGRRRRSRSVAQPT
ncbi:hypothetical protein Ait01nite_023030 [Actinoplanes italicus]|uniref:LPXTG-motif cell wall-anchored protein/predicted secreted protein with PEP-CTERM sorting signal n=1 Tax=Actinoplanes italicus TaxID=113567 RepID=A0A2T0KNH9_9ACTN|nr:LPXTG cell wall anchor domain-containing protein [Actinoplanes italicus]PRX25303.1 LPXTG-motif cell wall-anchored protein/predicted secreted protein with PEP-CTERM sorting signal [Actinoplanes italicus]GIE29258.1 hypothetical protein Ait01nite_023030 [Actinoplanes italicus]